MTEPVDVDEPSALMLLNFALLHAELFHGCDHTNQLRAQVEERRSHAETRGALDVERLASAMDDAWKPDYEFVDDHDSMWRPFAAIVAAEYEAGPPPLTARLREPAESDT